MRLASIVNEQTPSFWDIEFFIIRHQCDCIFGLQGWCLFSPPGSVVQFPALSMLRSVCMSLDTFSGAPWLACHLSTVFISSTLKLTGIRTDLESLFSVFWYLKGQVFHLRFDCMGRSGKTVPATNRNKPISEVEVFLFIFCNLI